MISLWEPPFTNSMSQAIRIYVRLIKIGVTPQKKALLNSGIHQENRRELGRRVTRPSPELKQHIFSSIWHPKVTKYLSLDLRTVASSEQPEQRRLLVRGRPHLPAEGSEILLSLQLRRPYRHHESLLAQLLSFHS